MKTKLAFCFEFRSVCTIFAGGSGDFCFLFYRVLGNLLKNKEMNYLKGKVSVLFMMFSMLFCTCLITANILETKQIDVFGIDLTCGLLVFPVSYIINDCVCEVWGYRKARPLIWNGFILNFFFVAVGALSDAIPGASYWDNQQGFHAIFGLTPRIAGASFIAFLVGSFVNAYVMSRMKIRSNGRHFSWRAIMSTVWGESADSVIFFPLALYGVVPDDALLRLMFWQVITKTLYEVIALPVTIRVVKWVKKTEGLDVYDHDVNYNVFRLD